MFSLLEQGREAEAIEHLGWYLGAANRRGKGSIELPVNRLTVHLKDRLQGLGFEVRLTTRDGKPSLEVRMASRSLNKTARDFSAASASRRPEL